MCHRFLLLLLSLLALGPQAPAQDAPALRVHIRGGVKTHGPGQHDHPRFLDEWTQLLAERGASATGSMEFPSAAELDDTDVLVFYAAEGGSIHGAERARLEGFIGRGGGLVVIHDAVCGDDSHWFKTIVGGAWEHGHSKWHEGEIGLYFKDREHPITRGASNFDFKDEIYWDLHLTEEAHVLAESFHSVFDVHPQMWVVEREHSAGVPYRAFVSIQGHEYTSFSHLAWRAMLLRGIAWAGKRDAELLTTQDERAALRYPAGGPTMPSAADATFSGNEDFEVSLVASEPAVLNPISIDWDARDRMWVACTPGYPLKAQNSGLPASDHILILEDRDGDGQAEHETEFYASLDLVTSLVHHKDGVIVSQAPDILWLRDLDGDDVCDVVVTLYSGFGFGDTHAVLSNLRWGMDGWIYATQGYSGGASRNVIGYGPTGTNDFGPIGNGLLRFRPDGSNIEMVSSYGSNTWGLDFSWDGELFFTMANGAHLRHIVLPEPVLARGRAGSARSWADVPDHHQAHPTSRHDRPPYVQIDFVGGFTAASGSLIYNGGAWPAEFAGNHFVAEPTLNLVHRDVIHSNGPSFTAVKPREGEFLAAEDLWFRPVHMRTGPDGAMYVLDFYNQAAIHNDTRGPEHGPTNAAIRPDRDRLHGRIWRVQHKAATALATLDFGSVDGCITSLSHPNRWARMTGQRLLAENEETALWWDQVTAMIGDSTLPAYARIHALHLHMQIAPDDVPAVIAALADMDESVRKNAAWIVADLKLNDHEAHDQHAHDHTDIDRETLTELTSGLLRQIEQPDDRLRLAALTALSTLPSSDQLRAALIPHLTMPQDDWTKSALLGNAYVDPKSFMVHTLLEGEGPVAGELVQTLVRRLASRFGTREVLIMCGALAPMRRANDEMVLALVRGLVSAIPESEVATWDEEIEEALMLLLMDDEMEIAKAAVPLVSHWDQEGKLESSLKRMAGSVMKDLIDEDSTWDTCLQSLDILLQLPTYRHSAIQVSLWMLEPGQPLDMQERAIVLFGTCNDLAAGQALITNLRNMTAAARNLAFPQILRRPDWCQALIDQVEAGDLSRTDLGPQRVFQLVEHPDAAVSERARATLTASNTDKDALIASLLPHVIQPGDVARGRTLFEEQCATCHSFRGAGADVGPPLDGMGAHGPAELLPFLVDPNRSVEENYLEYAVRTVDGLTVSGVIVVDAADRVVLRSSSGEASVAREDIEEIWSMGRTPMPEGLEELGADALRDILAYVCDEYQGWRIIDLEASATVATTVGLYDRREPVTYEFIDRGIVEVEGIPFEILDPATAQGGKDVITLKGAMAKQWDSWTKMPKKVEIPVGFAMTEMHILGGVAAWGWPFTKDGAPGARWTWVYADGEREEVILRDGHHFADWIRRHDVPGSTFVPGVLKPGTRGQLRRFSLRPARDAIIDRIELESFENHLSATFLALTARTGEAIGDGSAAADEEVVKIKSSSVQYLGGGSSHDFARWFGGTDVQMLSGLGLGEVLYTEDIRFMQERLAQTDLLVMSNNQYVPEAERPAIVQHVQDGGGLLVLHASCWHNWNDWPAWNRDFVGGGSRSHEALQEFEVLVQDAEHQLTQGLPASFRITDELYRFEPEAGGPALEVLAMGRSLQTGAEFPVLWTVASDSGRIAVTTLGHDGSAHQLPAFQRLLSNAARWLTQN